MKIDRIKQFEKRHEYERIPHKVDYAMQEVQMIDENGVLHTETKEVEVNETEIISKIPAYTTKIEYIQQYGTLDELGEVHYMKANPNKYGNDYANIAKKIIENELNNK